jgi:hypothetical protein
MRIAFAIFLSTAFVASVANACLIPDNVSESWTTYCDGTTERVRLTIEFHLSDVADLSESGSEFFVGVSCVEPFECTGPDGRSGVISDLGGGNYRFVLQGWDRACFPDLQAVRDGAIFWRCYYAPGESQMVLFRFYCADRARPIVDESTCVPLPVATSTWGAIKALYR